MRDIFWERVRSKNVIMRKLFLKQPMVGVNIFKWKLGHSNTEALYPDAFWKQWSKLNEGGEYEILENHGYNQTFRKRVGPIPVYENWSYGTHVTCLISYFKNLNIV